MEDISTLPSHPDADQKVLTYGAELVTALAVQARVLAFRQRDLLVLPRHVDEAYKLVN